MDEYKTAAELIRERREQGFTAADIPKNYAGAYAEEIWPRMARPDIYAASHDDKCEAEYVSEAPGWTGCDCSIRLGEVH